MSEVNFLVKKGLTVPKGSASTPAIIFDASDSNTGLYSPGADQVAVATNGTGRLFVDASGNVGIGVGAPSNYADNADNLVIYRDGNAGMTIAGSTTGKSSIYFADAPTGPGGSVGLIQYDHTDNYLRFNVNTAECLRITSAGLVGIGTSSPAGLMHLYGDTNSNGAELFLTVNNNNTTDNIGAIHFGNGVTSNLSTILSGTSGNNTSSYLTFSTSSTGTKSEQMRIDSSGRVGIGTTSPSEALDVSGNVTISGSISKGSGSFKITHPLETKKDTHYLVHSFIEGPRADLIYRGTAKLTNGKAVINLDLESNMTAGTFEALCANVSCFTSNETDWTPVKGSVSKNKLTIVAQDTASSATVSWLVVGERKDPHMLEANWTDENGRIIVEPEKEEA